MEVHVKGEAFHRQQLQPLKIERRAASELANPLEVVH